MDMVIKVARAIGAATDPNKAYQYLDGSRDKYPCMVELIPVARAAIAAMRELDSGMRISGEREMMARHPNLDCFRDPYVDSTWEKMIDAALGGNTDAA